MSIQALVWALEDAPDVPPNLVATLLGLANHADHDGKSAYPTIDRLMHYTRKSRRQVITDLTKLRELKLIKLGDQKILAHIDPRYRPVVYDLSMERRRARYTRTTSAPEQEPTTSTTAPQRRSATPEQKPSPEQEPTTSTASRGAVQHPQGCSTAYPGVQPTAHYEPSVNRPRTSPQPPTPSDSAETTSSGGKETSTTTDNPLAMAAEAACRHQPRWLQASVIAALKQAIRQGMSEAVACRVIVDLAEGGKYGPTKLPQRILAPGPWWDSGEVFIPAPHPKQAFTACPTHPSEPADTCRCCRSEQRGAEREPGSVTLREATRPQGEAAEILASLGFRRKVGAGSRS